MSSRTRAAGALLALASLVSAACGGDPTVATTAATSPATTSDATPTRAPGPPPTPSPAATPTPTAPPSPSPRPTPSPAPTTVDEPGWIEIAAADVRHDLHPRGLSADGTINPPGGTVMWYTGHDRVAPGRVGTAVVAAHVVSGGRPDVFHDLPDVEVGDQVRLGDADGGVMTFRVVSTEFKDKDAVAADRDVWGHNDTTRRLAIITCDDALGFRDDGHRVANFVVIAEAA